jgi:hypothetical protein
MPTTLHDIIEKSQTIIQEAQALGFMNVHLHYDRGLGEFAFIVTVNPNNPSARSMYTTLLAASLRQILDCEVEVMETTRIKPLFKENVEENMAHISDAEAIKKLLNTNNPKEIVFDALSDETRHDDEDLLNDIEDIKKMLAENLLNETLPKINTLDVSPQSRKHSRNTDKSSQLTGNQGNKKIRFETIASEKTGLVSYMITAPTSCGEDEILTAFRQHLNQQNSTYQPIISTGKK